LLLRSAVTLLLRRSTVPSTARRRSAVTTRSALGGSGIAAALGRSTITATGGRSTVATRSGSRGLAAGGRSPLLRGRRGCRGGCCRCAVASGRSAVGRAMLTGGRSGETGAHLIERDGATERIDATRMAACRTRGSISLGLCGGNVSAASGGRKTASGGRGCLGCGGRITCCGRCGATRCRCCCGWRRGGSGSAISTETTGRRNAHHGSFESWTRLRARDRTAGRGTSRAGGMGSSGSSWRRRRRTGSRRRFRGARLVHHQHRALELGRGCSLDIEAALGAGGGRFRVFRAAVRTEQEGLRERGGDPRGQSRLSCGYTLHARPVGSQASREV
jgi:hypothetical protein